MRSPTASRPSTRDSAFVTQLSITRNLFLGREPITGPGFLNRMDMAAMDQVARDLLKQVGITKNIPPNTPIGSLSGGERQAVAISAGDAFRQRPDHPRRADQQSRCRRDARRLRFVRGATNTGHCLSSSPTTSITSSRSSTASWSCARDEWLPKTTSNRKKAAGQPGRGSHHRYD